MMNKQDFLDDLSKLMQKHKASFFVTNSKELKKTRSSLYVCLDRAEEIELGYLVDPTIIEGLKWE